MPGVSPLRVEEVVKVSNETGGIANTESALPPLPRTVGNIGTITEPDTGNKLRFRVIDEVVQIRADYPAQAIFLQKIEFEEDGYIELRLGYYIIGKKPKMLGK